MHCVESTRMSINWNGKQLQWFKPSRGIRQGDTIFPYFFVLCMERLSNIIYPVVNTGRWKPIQVLRNGPHLSHLFFADDLLLFAKATEDQIRTIMECLNHFCRIYGQKVSLQKSSIFVSHRVDSTVAD